MNNNKKLIMYKGKNEYYIQFNLSIVEKARLIKFIIFNKEFQLWKDSISIRRLKINE